ncbi:hypothetical protein [Nitrospirillum sp. BR 11163]|uniref:hypothetical protein n=1 Tax=Nitrospirillum sp. BR 11163 TaxID=3104323 RepID=UPI002B003630|nr:hypothetical protein [Nitrospirillum sp. BR 11163]MEA1677223.1 hypothetical protein [Nitrospirillum sp. BR 11163]
MTPVPPQSSATPARLPLAKLPFVGLRRDGALGHWVMPADSGMAVGTAAIGLGRTYAAWFLLYAEINGRDAARTLLDNIEREMPSRYPAVDRAFLGEIAGRGFAQSAA